VRRAVAHLFVEDLDRPALAESDLHHLSRVLRLRPGEAVVVSDGAGGTRPCLWTGSVLLSPEGEVVREAAPAPLLTVAFALTKGDHPEWAVQKLTEAGVDRVVLMTTERCVVRWAPPAAGRQLERLRDVARQAAMQSRRAWLPAVEGPLPFAEVVAGQVALAVPGGRPLTLATPTVLIGPEGGWTDAELGSGPDHVGLGPHILRAETAALAAGVLLAGLRGGFVAPAPHSAPATPTRTKI
jgi:16S rRNA (uracil1498-N3)-methyltransferase